MNNVPLLTQKEVDSLLIAAGGELDDPSPHNPDSKVCDLSRPHRVIRGKLPTLDLIYERFVRIFRKSVSTSLNKIASISIISTDLMLFGEFVNTLPIPSFVFILQSTSLRGPMLLVCESRLAYALIENYLGGGNNSYTKSDGKEFTEIEIGILNHFFELATSGLEEAWNPVQAVGLKHIKTETNPQFVGVCPLSSVIVSTTFEVELENVSGTIALVIPYSTIEPIKDKLNSSYNLGSDFDCKSTRVALGHALEELSLNVSVNIGIKDLKLKQIVELKVGDEIRFSNSNVNVNELTVLIEDEPRFIAKRTEINGQESVEIINVIKKEKL